MFSVKEQSEQPRANMGLTGALKARPVHPSCPSQGGAGSLPPPCPAPDPGASPSPHHLGFCFPDGVVDLRDELPAPWQKMDPFAPAVGFVGTKADEIFLLQPGQQTGNRGVAQVEFFFNVPGAGGCFPVGDVAQNRALRCGQFHICQSMGHPLVGTPVKDPDIVAEVSFQKNHLQNKNVASYILYYHSSPCDARGNGKVYKLRGKQKAGRRTGPQGIRR